MNPVIQFLVLAAVEACGFVLLWFLLRARIRRHLELENLLDGVREEARALVTEMNETADRNVSLIEDRMGALKELLDEVDRRMGVARRELSSREVEREVYAQLSRRRPIVPPAKGASSSSFDAPRMDAPLSGAAPGASPMAEAPIPLPLAAKAPTKDEGGRSESPVQVSLQPLAGGRDDEPRNARARPEGPSISLSAEPLAMKKSRREEVVELHRAGFSVEVIAAKLGATLSEVELLVEIDERRSASLDKGRDLLDGSRGG
jgi:hypothetical protein